MPKKNIKEKGGHRNIGFTLIELLVVVAIISLLASVIIASVSKARIKARDVAIVSDVNQFRILMEEEYNDSSSYNNLEPMAWFTASHACTGIFTGNYATNAQLICLDILKNSGNVSIAGSGDIFYVGNSVDPSKKYSLMAWLPGQGAFYCVGSSGANSNVDTGTWTSPGCYANP